MVDEPGDRDCDDDPDLHARFELIAATIDHLPFASRRIADTLRQPPDISPPPVTY